MDLRFPRFALMQVLFANRGDTGEACKNTSPLTVHWEAKKDPLLTRLTVAAQLNSLVTLMVALNIRWLLMYAMPHHTIYIGKFEKMPLFWKDTAADCMVKL